MARPIEHRNIILFLRLRIPHETSEDKVFKLIDHAWLEIAGKRSKKISTPSWNEVNTLRDQSFPSVALKYNFVEKRSSSSPNISIQKMKNCGLQLRLSISTRKRQT
jgi:hypothetical protein